MADKKREHPKVKSRLHPRSKHRSRYDFKQLIESLPDLAPFVKLNAYGDESVDFADPQAVKMLNTALLKHFYQIDHWNIPEGYLCPPIPGRADYLHHIADLLAKENQDEIPRGDKISCLDIGVGANCIYPLIGNKEYGWSFVGSDIDQIAIDSANQIVANNPSLTGSVELRVQLNPLDIFHGILSQNERFDLVISNPPFHASKEDAMAGTRRKTSNLNHKKITEPVRNFGGQSNELWCEGGEKRFVHDMIYQSKSYPQSALWFSTLVSKQSNLKSIQKALIAAKTMDARTLPMGQGNKSSRIVAWTFFKRKERQEWMEKRWK